MKDIVVLKNHKEYTAMHKYEILYYQKYQGTICITSTIGTFTTSQYTFNKYNHLFHYFIKIQQGLYVNKVHIKALKDKVVILSNNQEIEISRTYLKAVIQELETDFLG